MFPFSVQYSTRLNGAAPSDDYPFILKQLQELLEKKTASDVVVWENGLEFKSRFFALRSRNNIMSFIDKGEVYIAEKEGETCLVYTIYMQRTLLIMTGMIAFIGIISHNPAIMLLGFLLIVPMNWLLTVIRHKFFLRTLKRQIDTLVSAGITSSYVGMINRK